LLILEPAGVSMVWEVLAQGLGCFGRTSLLRSARWMTSAISFLAGKPNLYINISDVLVRVPADGSHAG
jgi:hypothetical protein